MGLIVKKKSGERGLLGIWEIDGSEAHSPILKTFSASELAQLEVIKAEQKKLQWIAARLLLLEIHPGKIQEILYDTNGKPFLDADEMKLSISHSGNKVAMILEPGRETGIDIEVIRPKIERISSKFMSPSEMEELSKENRLEELFIHWCAKEALYKLYGKKELVFKEHLRIAKFNYAGKGNVTGSIHVNGKEQAHALCYEKSGEHMLVYVTYN